jgi:hypothetical protein
MPKLRPWPPSVMTKADEPFLPSVASGHRRIVFDRSHLGRVKTPWDLARDASRAYRHRRTVATNFPNHIMRSRGSVRIRLPVDGCCSKPYHQRSRGLPSLAGTARVANRPDQAGGARRRVPRLDLRQHPVPGRTPDRAGAFRKAFRGHHTQFPRRILKIVMVYPGAFRGAFRGHHMQFPRRILKIVMVYPVLQASFCYSPLSGHSS